MELEEGLLSRGVVGDLHGPRLQEKEKWEYTCKSHPPSLPPSLPPFLPPSPPHLINPHVPDDNIVYGGDHLGPGVVAVGAVYHEVGDSDGVDCYVLPPELGGHRVLLPEGPVLVLHMHGKHGRMVAHLWVWGEREGESLLQHSH